VARMHLSCCRSPHRALPSHVTFGTRRRSTSEHPPGPHPAHLPGEGHPVAHRRLGAWPRAFCKRSRPDHCWIQAGTDARLYRHTLPETKRVLGKNRARPRDREGVINPCKREQLTLASWLRAALYWVRRRAGHASSDARRAGDGLPPAPTSAAMPRCQQGHHHRRLASEPERWHPKPTRQPRQPQRGVTPPQTPGRRSGSSSPWSLLEERRCCQPPAGTDPLAGTELPGKPGRKDAGSPSGFQPLCSEADAGSPGNAPLQGAAYVQAALLQLVLVGERKTSALVLWGTLAKPEPSRQRQPRRGHLQLQGICRQQRTFDFRLLASCPALQSCLPKPSCAWRLCEQKHAAVSEGPVARLRPCSTTARPGAEKGPRASPAPATAAKLSKDVRGRRRNLLP